MGAERAGIQQRLVKNALWLMLLLLWIALILWQPETPTDPGDPLPRQPEFTPTEIAPEDPLRVFGALRKGH